MSLRRTTSALGASLALTIALAVPQAASADQADDHEAGASQSGDAGDADTSNDAGDPDGPAVDEDGKIWVCKFVGTPGDDERLKDGKNPIHVDANSQRNNLPDIENIQFGDEWTDAQERSVVVDGPDDPLCQPTEDDDEDVDTGDDDGDNGNDGDNDDNNGNDGNNGGGDRDEDVEVDAGDEVDAGNGDNDEDVEVDAGDEDDDGNGDNGDVDVDAGVDDEDDVDQGNRDDGFGVGGGDPIDDGSGTPVDTGVAGNDIGSDTDVREQDDVEVLAATQSREQLPRTGVSTLALALSGLLALGAGVTSVTRTRRTPTA